MSCSTAAQPRTAKTQRRIAVLLSHLNTNYASVPIHARRLIGQASCAASEAQQLHRENTTAGAAAAAATPTAPGEYDMQANAYFYWNIVALVIISQLSALHRTFLQPDLASPTAQDDGKTSSYSTRLTSAFDNQAMVYLMQYLSYYYSIDGFVRRYLIRLDSQKQSTVVGATIIPLGIIGIALTRILFDGHDVDISTESASGRDEADGEETGDAASTSSADHVRRILRIKSVLMKHAPKILNLIFSGMVGFGSGVIQRTALSNIIIDYYQPGREQDFASSLFLALSSMSPLFGRTLHGWISVLLAMIYPKKYGGKNISLQSTVVLAALITVLVVPLLYRSLHNLRELYGERIHAEQKSPSSPIKSPGVRTAEFAVAGVAYRRPLRQRIAASLRALRQLVLLVSLGLTPQIFNNLSGDMILKQFYTKGSDKHLRFRLGLFNGLGYALPGILRLLGVGFSRNNNDQGRSNEEEEPATSWLRILRSGNTMLDATMLLQLVGLAGVLVLTDPSLDLKKSSRFGVRKALKYQAMLAASGLLYLANSMSLPLFHRIPAAPEVRSWSSLFSSFALPGLLSRISTATGDEAAQPRFLVSSVASLALFAWISSKLHELVTR